MKTLTINGDLYAKYEIHGTRIHLKTFKELIPNRPADNEDCIIGLIQLIEKTNFTEAGFLNVK